MRATLWFLGLFGIAVAVALFAGDNPGLVTVFWHPYRVDLSLNLVLVLLVGGFAFMHFALRALSALFQMPRQAQRWRLQQKERTMHGALLDASSHLMAGRFIRARKAAEAALVQEQRLRAAGGALPNGMQLRAVAHLLAAESSHALQDRAGREMHLDHATESAAEAGPTAVAQETREGVQLRAARWALDDRDPQTALALLDALPQGAGRRTLALRIRLKAARHARHIGAALETTRALARHRAFTEHAAQSIVRGLACELLAGAHDLAQLHQAWSALDPAERTMPDVATQAAQRLVALGGDAATARDWLLPAWERMVAVPPLLGPAQSTRLVQALEAGLHSVDPEWFARIEAAHVANPRDAHLQYLCGVACMHRQLWGKAQQLLTQAVGSLQQAALLANAWRALATLAELRGDEEAAAVAWRRAAEVR